jgi:hypothetical protein
MGEIAARFAPDSFIETKAPRAMPMTSRDLPPVLACSRHVAGDVIDF